MRHNHNTKTCLQWHLALMGYFAFTDTSQLYHKIYIATEHIFKVKLNKKLQTNTPRDVQSSVCVTAPQLYFLPCADSPERERQPLHTAHALPYLSYSQLAGDGCTVHWSSVHQHRKPTRVFKVLRPSTVIRFLFLFLRASTMLLGVQIRQRTSVD